MCTHPCKERKDGAPSSLGSDMQRVKVGHPPPVWARCKMITIKNAVLALIRWFLSKFNLRLLTQADQQATAMLERSSSINFKSFENALDSKQGTTEGHARRVTAFTIAIARAMGLSTDRIRVVARAAFLHDIGKMGIPDAILRKPGRLDGDEIAIMREHAFRGFEIVQRIPFLAESADIIYCHHERYDGTGYPRGLRAEQIPLGARILVVANTLDSLTSNLPYRAAQPFSAARQEIKQCSERQFDPQVVKAFLEMPENIWGDLRNDI